MSNPNPSRPAPRGPLVGAALATAIGVAIVVVATGLLRHVLTLQNVDLRISGFVPTITPWPFGPQFSFTLLLIFALGLVLTPVVAAVLSAVSAFGADPRRGALTVVLGSWFACVFSGACVGLVSSTLLQSLVYKVPSGAGQPWWSHVANGGYWGLATGWFPAALAGVAFLVANGRQRPDPGPGSAHIG